MRIRKVFILFMGCILIGLAAHTPSLQAQERVLSFEDALQIAKSNSPDIRQVKLAYERSKELLNAQKAALKSQFSLTLEPVRYTSSRTFDDFFSTWYDSETKQSSGTFNIAQPLIWTDGTIALRNQFLWQDSYSETQETNNKTFTNNLFIEYSQPFFTYNRTRMVYEEVQLDMENALLNYHIQELLLEQRVARNFYDVYKKQMSLQVPEEELQNTTQSLSIIQNKVNAGLTAKEELYQAELNLANSKSSLHNARVAYENALDQLKRALGISLFEHLSIAADISETETEVNLDKAIDYGLKYRMELKQREIDILISQNNIVRAAATNEFKGNLALRYGVIGNDEKLENLLYDTPAQDRLLSLSLEIPLYDWGEKESRVRAAEASVKSQKISLEEQKTDIVIEIRQAYRNMENQKYQTEIARQNVKVAQLTYDINLERYQNGDLTSMDLNLFQSQLSAKKTNLVDALITYKLALLDIKIRSLWDFEKNRAVLIIKPEEE